MQVLCYSGTMRNVEQSCGCRFDHTTPKREYSNSGRCSACKEKRDGARRYCNRCHAEYMRNHRPRHSALSEEARMRSNARAYLNVYIKRGKVRRERCFCGEPAEAHHEDYSKPLDVIWLCRAHHLARHRATDE